MQRDLGFAGVAIDGVPPSNIRPMQLSLFRSVFPALNPLTPASKPWHMTFKQFQYSWEHTLPLAEQRKAYSKSPSITEYKEFPDATHFPNAGFHKRLVQLELGWLTRHPLNPLPVFKW